MSNLRKQLEQFMQLSDEELEKSSLAQLSTNKYRFDCETHAVLWESQCLLQLIDEAIGDRGEIQHDVIQLAVNGVERLLDGALRRSGWSGLGPRWEKKARANHVDRG